MTDKKTKKRKFSVHQIVVIRFSDRKMVGEVVSYKPLGKRFIYDVLCENGKIYHDLDVDIEANECIDTYLTKLYYQKNKIDIDSMPALEEDEPALYSMELTETGSDEVEEEDHELVIDHDMLFDADDLDPNY